MQNTTVVIIESLNEAETGETLYINTLRNICFQNEKILRCFIRVNSKEEFLNRLNGLITEALEKDEYYVLHFEIHGFNGGIELSNGDRLTWKEILPLFRKLNVHYNNSLLVCLAICEGSSLIASTNPAERSPFGILISCPNRIKEQEIVDGFAAFYDLFLNSNQFYEALDLYNSYVSQESNKMYYITSSILFDMICDIDRSLDNKTSLVQLGVEKLKISHPTASEEELIQLSTKMADKLFSDLRKKRPYFLMQDLTTDGRSHFN